LFGRLDVDEDAVTGCDDAVDVGADDRIVRPAAD